MGLESFFNQNFENEASKSFNERLKIWVPYKSFPELRLFTNFEAKKEDYSLDLRVDGKDLKMATFFNGRSSEKFLDAILQGEISSPILTIPLTKIKILRDNSDSYKDIMNFDLEILTSKYKKHFAKIFWNIGSQKNFEINFQTELPLQPFENLALNIDFDTQKSFKTANISLDILHNSIDAKGYLDGDQNITGFKILSEIFNEK